jgi:hypothetical protein
MPAIELGNLGRCHGPDQCRADREIIQQSQVPGGREIWARLRGTRSNQGKLRYLKHPGGPSEARPQITHRRTPLGRRGPVGAPRSVSHFTFERRKMCEPHLAKMRDENASHRMDRPRRPGRAWPALVGCRDVQIGPHAQRGNQLGLDAVRMASAGSPALRQQWHHHVPRWLGPDDWHRHVAA